ncbi:zinc ribbon domain-containing protein, partial [Streptomyces harbinensis]|uniref:zinc ribbon domain-containing protein n=1 Tax=Streptomyces harbinensis TaxID=1176198 RepID=UPI0034DDF08D
MISCPECGQGNAAGTRFCDACGAFLDWEEAEAREPQEPRNGPGPAGGPVP